MDKRIRLDAAPALYPLPVVLVSSGHGRAANIMTAAWVGIASSEPPVVAVGIRPDRHTHGLVSAAGAFGINVPSSDMERALATCGRVSGRDADKFELLGLTPTAADASSATCLVEECPVSMECRLIQVVSLGSHDLFLGEVVAVWANQDCVAASGRVDPGLLDMVCYAAGQYLPVEGQTRPRPAR